MIDLHTHILPGVDDGAMDLKDSLDLAKLAVRGGTGYLVATPHANQTGRFENYFDKDLKERYFLLQKELKENNIKLNLYLGMEIYCMGDVKVIEQKILNKQLIGLNDTDYYLVEFPFQIEKEYIHEVQEMIFDLGRIPLIAHPERYSCVQEEPWIVYEWIKEGVSTQVNKGSIFGRFGPLAQTAVKTLYDHDLVTCVSSDAHNPNYRSTWMADIKEYLTKNYGEAYTKRVTMDNSALILLNKDVPMHGRWQEGEK